MGFWKNIFWEFGILGILRWSGLKDMPPINGSMEMTDKMQKCRRCENTYPPDLFNVRVHICDYCREPSKIDRKEKKKEYSTVRNQIEIECDICQCKVRKFVISKQLKTLKHIENENKVKTTVEEEKPNEVENSKPPVAPEVKKEMEEVKDKVFQIVGELPFLENYFISAYSVRNSAIIQIMKEI